jgi:hypothetical protein
MDTNGVSCARPFPDDRLAVPSAGDRRLRPRTGRAGNRRPQRMLGRTFEEPVHSAHPADHQIRPVRGQRGQLEHQHIRGGDKSQVPAHPGGVSDDPDVLGVGLAPAAQRSSQVGNHPAGDVDHILAAGQQHCQQQRCHRADQIHAHRTWSPDRPARATSSIRRSSLTLTHRLPSASIAAAWWVAFPASTPTQATSRTVTRAFLSSALVSPVSSPADRSLRRLASDLNQRPGGSEATVRPFSSRHHNGNLPATTLRCSGHPGHQPRTTTTLGNQP